MILGNILKLYLAIIFGVRIFRVFEVLGKLPYTNIKKITFFSDSDKPRMLFFLLINVKMLTIVGILTFMSRKNFMQN